MIVPICQGINCAALMLAGALAQLQPPPVEQMPLSITSYWLFDDAGQPVAWGGQADGNPEVYANLHPTSAAHEWQVAGCVQDWTKLYEEEAAENWTTAVFFSWQGEARQLLCFDNFGDVDYRQPFFHERYGRWVVPVDVLTNEPVYGLVWAWSTEMVRVGDK